MATLRVNPSSPRRCGDYQSDGKTHDVYTSVLLTDTCLKTADGWKIKRRSRTKETMSRMMAETASYYKIMFSGSWHAISRPLGSSVPSKLPDRSSPGGKGVALQ
jgi:hypothetical protein